MLAGTREKVDLLHCPYWSNPVWSPWPTVVTVHDTSPITHPERCHPDVQLFVPVLRRLVQSGAWVHTPSEHVADEVRDLFNTDRVSAIHSGAPATITSGTPAATACSAVWTFIAIPPVIAPCAT